MSNEAPQPPQKPRRWLWPVLFLSLALNLLIVGIVVGAVLQGGDRRKDGDLGPARSLMGEPFVRALEPEDRRALGRDILSNRDALRENRSDLRRRVEALLDALRQDTFDRAAVSDLLSEQRQLAVSRQEVGETFLLNRLEAMSAEERRAYADRLAKSLLRFRRN